MSSIGFLCDAHEHLQHDQFQLGQLGKFLHEERYVMMILGHGMGSNGIPVVFLSRLYSSTGNYIERAATIQRKLSHDISAYELTMPSQFSIFKLSDAFPRNIRDAVTFNGCLMRRIDHGSELYNHMEHSLVYTHVRTASFRNNHVRFNAVDHDGRAFASVEITVHCILEQLERLIREHQ
jgi:hypothetical protein